MREVVQKLRSMMKTDADEIDVIVVKLISDNFQMRNVSTCSFATDNRMKQWGKIRIVNELKFKKINR
jgi:regulatory protein